MNDQSTIFSPERNQWTLTDGRHHMEVPEWAREIMRDEFERETRPLRDNLDLALDSKRIAERRVTGLLDENAKLRELLGGVGHLLFILDVDYCVACPRDSISHPCPVYTIKGGECLYKSDMRELGVEVDG